MINSVSVVGGLLPFNYGNVNQTFKALVVSSSSPDPFAAIVKDLPHRELFNELISFLVLQGLGLPVPEAYIGLVPSSEASISEAPKVGEDLRAVFVSKEVPSPSLRMVSGLDSSATNVQLHTCLEKLVPQIAKWAMLGELYAFDSWIANIDRNLGNLLFSGSASGEPDVWIIDHGKTLTSESWQPADLKPDDEYINKLRAWATPYLTEDNKKKCLASAIRFEAKARSFDKDANVDYLSSMFNLSTAESDAAKKFLNVRLGRLVDRSREALDVGGVI